MSLPQMLIHWFPTVCSNPKDYADNQDARQYDSRLRPPVRQVELDIDPDTGMKNYIANERGDWATSSGYIKYSLARSIRYGRLYTSGGQREEDLCEALRCLGQGLHTLEDFAAHTNYCELALREMGFHNVFPHTGSGTQMDIRGRFVFPLVTGTFGMVDFFHSMLGEATDHVTQSEVNDMDIALGDAQSNSSSGALDTLLGSLKNIPGADDLISEARELQRQSEAQDRTNQDAGYADYERSRGLDDTWSYSRGMGDVDERTRASDAQSPVGLPGMPDFNPQQTVAKIYPILAFRDKVVRRLSDIVEKIPGLETLVEKVSETLTVFVMSLLAPFIRPIIKFATESLKAGSASVLSASSEKQFEPWDDPSCTDPTHSLLSKDHFSNILNEPAGQVASEIVKYVAPRVLYAWENTDFPEQQVLGDCLSVFHHPALRDMRHEAHRNMFEAVQRWAYSRPDQGASLNDILSAEGVREGKNNGGHVGHSHGGGGGSGFPAFGGVGAGAGAISRPQQQTEPEESSSSRWGQIANLSIPGISSMSSIGSKFSSLIPNAFSSGSTRNNDRSEYDGGYSQGSQQEYTESSTTYTESTTEGGYYQRSTQSYSSSSNRPPVSHYSEYSARYTSDSTPEVSYSSGYGDRPQGYSEWQRRPLEQDEADLAYGEDYGRRRDHYRSRRHGEASGYYEDGY